MGSTAKFIFEDHPASFQVGLKIAFFFASFPAHVSLQGNIHFEDDLIEKTLRGRRRIQEAVPAVPNHRDAQPSNQPHRPRPRLPDPVPAVPGVLKVGPTPVVDNSIEVKATLPTLNVLAPDGRIEIGQAFDSVISGLVRGNLDGLVGNLDGLVRDGASGLVSHPNGALVPQDEPEVAAARAKILALLAEETKIALLSEDGQTNTNHKVKKVDPTYGADYRHPVHHNHQAGGPRYKGELNLNVELVSHPNGALVPADEPAVLAARASHLAAPGHLLKDVIFGALNGHSVKHGHGLVNHHQDLVKARPNLVKHPNGAIVPVDSPDVRAARAAHLAHHQKH